MTKLRTQTLGAICDAVGGTIRTGPFGSQLHESDYREDGVPVVMPKNIVGGRISLEGIARIGHEDEARLAQHKLNRGDIVYGRRGDIGRRALITEREDGWLCGTGCLRISVGDSLVDPVFLYYFLGQPSVTAWIYNQAIGATLPNLNTDIIRSVVIRYPALTAQRKTAAVLSAYDNLIENNRRRITILEEMARLIYREWFVHFRFPGHDKVKLVESPQGKLPGGWRFQALKELAAVNKESIRGSEAAHEIQYIDISSVAEGRINKVEPMAFAEAPGRARRMVASGDVIWSMVRPNRKSYALILNPPSGLIVSTGFAVISAKNVPFSYIYCALSTDDFVNYLTNHTTGAAYPAVHPEDFENAELLRPPDALLCRFHEAVASMLQQVRILEARNANLRRARDLLVPRLVSGEIDVSCAT